MSDLGCDGRDDHEFDVAARRHGVIGDGVRSWLSGGG
jgi:hypothetical protein